MYNLRESSTIKIEKNELFDFLPTEIYYHIFVHLSPQELLTLRLVNKHLNNVVESHSPLWKKQVYIALNSRISSNDYEENEKNNIIDRNYFYLQMAKNQKVVEFLNRVAFIDFAQFMCDVELETTTNSNLVIESKYGRSNDRHFELFFLNTNFIKAYLNLFANCCDRLTIKSFYEPPSFSLLPNFPKLVEMKYVKCLNVTCNIHDFTKNAGFQKKRGIIFMTENSIMEIITLLKTNVND